MAGPEEPTGAGPAAFLVRSNFGRMRGVLQQLLPAGGGGEAGQVDAILLDLGISSMQVGGAVLVGGRFCR